MSMLLEWCTIGDGEVRVSGDRGDHSDSPIFNNGLHRETVTSWYTGTVIAETTQ